jgi:hypothetical protein
MGSRLDCLRVKTTAALGERPIGLFDGNCSRPISGKIE